jgi:hypothetical protein
MISGVLGKGREEEYVALCFWDIRSGLDACQPPGGGNLEDVSRRARNQRAEKQKTDNKS